MPIVTPSKSSGIRLLRGRRNESTTANDRPPLPPGALKTLSAAGFDQTVLDDHNTLVLRGDLDKEGRWGERYLVATPQRLAVLSLDGLLTESSNGLTNGVLTKPEDNRAATLDWVGSLEAVRDIKLERLVGVTAIEARLDATAGTELSGSNGQMLNGHGVNGHAANGHAANGRATLDDVTTTVATTNGATTNGAAAPGAGVVVELLRGSAAETEAFATAVEQVKSLREKGELPQPDAPEEKEIAKVCPKCGRAYKSGSTICFACGDRWGAMRRLMGYLKPYKWLAIGNGLLSVTAIGLSFVGPLVVQALTDKVFPPEVQRDAGAALGAAGDTLSQAESRWLLAFYIILIVVASLLSAAISVLRGRWTAYLGAHVLHDIRSELYTHLQRLSLAFYDKREIGAVMSRVQNDVGMLQNFLLDGAESLILNSLTIAVVIGIMLYKAPVLALIVLIPVPFVIVGTQRYWKGLIKLWRRVRHQNSVLSARLADTLGGVRVVRAFAQEDREVGRFLNKSGDLRDATKGVEQKAASFYPVIEFVMGLGLPLVWYFGGLKVLDGTLTFGILLLFVMLLGRLYAPIQQLTRLVNFITRAMTGAERVFEVLDTEPEVRQSADAVGMPAVKGCVEFRDVIFGYDKNRPVLHGVDLVVEPGEMIGLVGHSGAGKSTLINLLMRFYDVNGGAILVDGVDMRDINRDDLRAQIGVVLQEPYLFHGTVFENIAYAKPGATPAEVMAAAQAAYAHNFIVSFPDGYDTLVGERGTRLSGGERQRISIARAILHDPKILILDEATASVDTQTESQIQNALTNLISGRTTFAIAHRLSTLRNADRLVVLDEGRIAEMGTHDELLANKGTFYKLVEAQKAMSEITAVGG